MGGELWDVDLADGRQIEVAGTVLQVLHTPGHAPGAVCLHAPDLGCPLSSAVYDPATLTVTLTPARRLSANGVYMVSSPLSPAPVGPYGYVPPQPVKITDLAGNRLANATPGFGPTSGFFNVQVSRRQNRIFGPGPTPPVY